MAKRLTYEGVRNEVESHNIKLVSTEYVNLKTEMEFECPLGHRFSKTLAQIRRNQSCPVCEANSLQKQNIALNESVIVKKKKGVQRVMALDNATHVTGFSIFDDGKLVYYGTISVGHMDTVKRISRMRQWMIAMIEKWEPDVVGLEDIQLQKQQGLQNVSVYKTLAQLLGVLENTLFELNIQYYVIVASTWKSHNNITGRVRDAQKKSAQEMIKKLYDVSVSQDEADAILIGKYLSERHIRENEMHSWV